MAAVRKKKPFIEIGIYDHIVETLDLLGWRSPMSLQKKVIPVALENKDIVAVAENGSEKTGAFAIPILHSLLGTHGTFFACVLAPTERRATEIANQFETLGSGIAVKCALLVGGKSLYQRESLSKKPHIIVATPDCLICHLSDIKGFLGSLKYLVLDEADKFQDKAIHEILKCIPHNRTTYLFSATITLEVEKLITCLKNPVKIEYAVKQQYCCIPLDYKDCYLYYILTEMSGLTSVVFTRECAATVHLTYILRILGLSAVAVNGKMTSKEFLDALRKFRSGTYNILVCTDVAIRRLDIPSIDNVINFDIPDDPEEYILRVRRISTRVGCSGAAISIGSQDESALYEKIEKRIGEKLPKYNARKDEVAKLLERVSKAKSQATESEKKSGKLIK